MLEEVRCCATHSVKDVVTMSAPRQDSGSSLPSVERRAARHDPYAAIRSRNCRFFLSGNILSTIGSQMMYLAISWELYQTTGSPTALGIGGFFQVLPILLFSIPAGHLIDRYHRRTIVVIDQALLAVTALMLAASSLERTLIPDWGVLHGANFVLSRVAMTFHETGEGFTSPYIPLMLAILLLNGLVRSVNQPAKQSLLPQLVPARDFPNAASWHASSVEASTMIGPTIAGFMLAFIRPNDPHGFWPYSLVYASTAVLQFVSMFFFWGTAPADRASPRAADVAVSGGGVGVCVAHGDYFRDDHAGFVQRGAWGGDGAVADVR